MSTSSPDRPKTKPSRGAEARARELTEYRARVKREKAGGGVAGASLADMMARLAATAHTEFGMDTIMPVFHSQLEADAVGAAFERCAFGSTPSDQATVAGMEIEAIEAHEGHPGHAVQHMADGIPALGEPSCNHGPDARRPAAGDPNDWLLRTLRSCGDHERVPTS